MLYLYSTANTGCGVVFTLNLDCHCLGQHYFSPLYMKFIILFARSKELKTVILFFSRLLQKPWRQNHRQHQNQQSVEKKGAHQLQSPSLGSTDKVLGDFCVSSPMCPLKAAVALLFNIGDFMHGCSGLKNHRTNNYFQSFGHFFRLYDWLFT